MSEDLTISEEFIKENQAKPRPKKGGPYSKQQRLQRQNEVFRLYFEQGYSARQISDKLKVNRHTIDSDINHCYSQLSKEWKSHDLESWFMKQFQRLESQRIRLMQQLEKQHNLASKLAIEKMILDIDTRMMQLVIRINESKDAKHEEAATVFNQWAREHKLRVSVLRAKDVFWLPPKINDKVRKIIRTNTENRRARF